MNWYYAENEQQIGPIDAEGLEKLVSEGTITAETLVWNESMSEWKPYGAIAGAPAQAQQGFEPTAGSAQCVQCSRNLATSEMVAYQGSYVCANCKDTFFQRIQEGAGGIIGGGGTGVTANADLMAQAREALAGRWGLAVGFNVLLQLLLVAASVIPYVGTIGQLLVSGPFYVGSSRFHIAVARQEPDARIGMMFEGFQRFGTALGALLLQTIFILLWSLLLIIPGIMAAYSYMMTFYIIADDPHVTAMDALRRSKTIMYGSRFKLFCLYWRFFGWSLLCVLSFGIGFLWLYPYMNTSMAKFYEDVRGKAA